MCNQPGTKLERGEIVNVKNTPGHPLCNFQEMLNQATGQYLSKASVTHWIRSTLEELLWIFGSLFKCKCVLEEISAERVQSGGAVKLWWRLKCVGSCFPHFFFHTRLSSSCHVRDERRSYSKSSGGNPVWTDWMLSGDGASSQSSSGWAARCHTAERLVRYSLTLGLGPVLQTGLGLDWCWKGSGDNNDHRWKKTGV